MISNLSFRIPHLEEYSFGRFTPKAVLFDMDGVLYDSMPNHAIAWQQSMARFGINMTAEDAYATEGARGIDTIRNMVLQQKGETITQERAQEMYDEKTRIFHSLPEAKIMDGVISLMEEIHQRGWTIGVVTGSGQRPLINRLLTDFHEYLDEKHVVTAYDVKRGKPNPDPYLMGMEKVGTQPSQTIVIENAPLGIMAGVAAKAFTIAVNTGPLDDSILLKANPNALCHNMYEAKELITTL